jgi:hypothetical protein
VLAALASAAFLLRYIGISLVVVGGIALLVALRPPRLARSCRGVRAAVRARARGVHPPNHAADGTLLGNRLLSHDTLRAVGSHVLDDRWLGGAGDERIIRVGLVGLAAVAR